VRGKSVGDDFRERKMTMPVILAYRAARDEEERKFWRHAFAGGEASFEEARRLIDRDRIGEAALTHADSFALSAADAARALPEHPLRKVLIDLALASSQRPS
jgi:octaprenyl-diphosphate synthase